MNSTAIRTAVYRSSNTKRLTVLAALVLLTACSGLPDKQYVVVDEYQMAYATQGAESPVVVLESGFGSPMENWSKVYPHIAEFTRVFSYNRRGYQGSIPQELAAKESTAMDITRTVGEFALDAVAPAVSTAIEVVEVANGISKTAADNPKPPRTAKQIVEEMRALLTQTGMQPPYLLVGHSAGGLNVLYYAKAYPDEVAGIVLVDATHPEQMQRCRIRFGSEACDVPWLVKSFMQMLPDEMKNEFEGIEESGRQVLAAGLLPEIPLTVISRGKTSGSGSSSMDHIWPELQQDLAAQLPNSRHIIAEKSGHFIQKDEPELVIAAIKEMVSRIRPSR